MLVTPEEMRRIEERAFAAGATPELLMEAAGAAVAGAVRFLAPRARHAVLFCGKGHNAGDAFVAGRHLAEAGWTLELDAPYPVEAWAGLARSQFERIPPEAFRRRPHRAEAVALDGLLGIGAKGPLREPLTGATARLAAFRAAGGRVFALDLPTGLDGESGEPGEGCVVADYTLAIGLAKTGLVADAATEHVGRLAVLPVEGLEGERGKSEVLSPSRLRGLFPFRPFGWHKGDAGRVTVIGGARGMTGAGCLAAAGALRGGAGLVTLCVPDDAVAIAAARAPIEAMVRPLSELASVPAPDAWVIGPGAGRGLDAKIREWHRDLPKPLVLDADGLTALAYTGPYPHSEGPRLYTPHPGEMGRMLGHPISRRDRASVAREWVEGHGGTLLLKGARTLIATKGRPLAYNTTGTPGMATGGMGDVLSGLLGALLARGLDPHDAACAGAWIAGRAGERRIQEGAGSEESLVAGDVLDEIGAACNDLRSPSCV